MKIFGESLVKKSPMLLILSLGCLLYITAASAEEESMAAHEHSRHHAAVFLGNTNKNGENAFTIGADYSYRLTPMLSVGGLVDYAGGQLDETLVAATLAVHPVGGLEFLVGVGASFAEEEEEIEEEGELRIEEEDNTEAAVRLGTLYEFELGAFSLSPTVNLDLVDGEEAWALGLNFGRSF